MSPDLTGRGFQKRTNERTAIRKRGRECGQVANRSRKAAGRDRGGARRLETLQSGRVDRRGEYGRAAGAAIRVRGWRRLKTDERTAGVTNGKKG